MVDVGGLIHLGGPIPGLVVGLDAVRQQADQALRRKAVSCISPWLPLQFLSLGSTLTSFDDGL